jgi:hypothetical protein
MLPAPIRPRTLSRCTGGMVRAPVSAGRESLREILS